MRPELAEHTRASFSSIAWVSGPELFVKDLQRTALSTRMGDQIRSDHLTSIGSVGDSSRNVVGRNIRGTVFQAGVIHGGVTFHGSGQRRFRVLATLLVVAVALGWPAATSPRQQPPQLQAKEKLINWCARKLVDDERSRMGGPTGYTAGLVYEIVVQNPSDAEIILTELRADVRRRQSRPSNGRLDPAPRTCRFWTDQPVRDLVVNLDVDHPRAVSGVREQADGRFSLHLPTAEPPRKSFPYKVLRGEPEVFHVGFESSQCDCEFTLVLGATVEGEAIETVLPTLHRIVPKGQ